jgi:malate dehydrogenase
METIKCVVTGALGSVAYNLIYFIAQGLVFPGRKISLRLVELPSLSLQLEGLRLEVLDCAFSDVTEVLIGSDPFTMFEDADFVFLVGAKPRGLGMERKDLLETNGIIFQEQGKALEAVAKKSVRVVVVGNPCNTNCLIALKNAPSIPPDQFVSLSYLDELRARALLAGKVGIAASLVSHITIWGNHSSTLVPDITYTIIDGKKAFSCVQEDWFFSSFIPEVRNRGSTIIKLRGKSSSASAAWAAAVAGKAFFSDSDWRNPISMGVYSYANPYGLDKDVVFSFSCSRVGEGLVIDPSLKPDERLWDEVVKSQKELIEERDAVKKFLP